MAAGHRKILFFIIILLPIILIVSLYHYLMVRIFVPYPGEGGMQEPSFISERMEFFVIHNSMLVFLLSVIAAIIYFMVPLAKSDSEKGIHQFLIFTGYCLLCVPILNPFSFFPLCFATILSLILSIILIVRKQAKWWKAMITVFITAFSAFWSILYFLHSLAVWGD
jgi:hypothetical protein